MTFSAKTMRASGAKAVLLVALLTSGSALAQSSNAPPPQLENPNDQPLNPPVTTAPAVSGSVEDTGGLGDIVVTATRRQENLQDVPVSVTAIGAEQLASRGISASNDLGLIVPNLQISSQYGDTQPNFSMRGVGVTNEFAANVSSPIGVYVDEVSQTFRYTHGLQLYDLDRVEVLRGPQGTLFGRNNTGGAVSIFTRKPGLGASNGYISGGYGNFDRYKVQAAAEFSPAADVVGLRFAINYGRGDGLFRDPQPNPPRKSYGTVNTLGARASLRVKPNDDLDIVLTGYYAKDNPVGYPLHYIGLVGADAQGRGGTDFFGSTRATCCGYKEVALNNQGRFRTEATGVSLNINYALSDAWSITSVTGYVDSSYNLDTDNDGTPLDVYFIDYNSKGKDLSQDVRVNYESDRLKGLIGFYYGRDTINSGNVVLAYNVLPDAPPGTTPAQWMPGVANSFNVQFGYRQKRKTYAFYGEGTYSITDALELTLGARYTKDKIQFLDGFSTPITDSPGVPLFDIYRDLDVTNSYDNWSGRAILNYAWTDDIKTYASFSRGYRSGSYNGFGFVTPAAIYFVLPERLDSYEFGFKTRFFNDRLQLNGAGFYFDYKNQQVQEVIGGVSFTRNLNATVKGAELELLARPIPALTLRGSLGYLDSKYKQNNPLLSGVSVAGNEVPFASKWTLSFGGDLTVAEFDAGSSVVASAEASYRSRFFYDAFNENQRPDPTNLYGPSDSSDLVQSRPYTIVNARLSYITPGFTISAWAKNLFDEQYFPFGYDTAGAFGTVLLTPGAPRTYGVEATVKF